MSSNKKYKQRIGSRAQVMHETVKMTSGGLTKKQLKYNKYGKIVSIKASNASKKSKNLIKAGYIAKKGHFKVFKNKNKYLQKAGMNHNNDLFSNIVPMYRKKHNDGLINKKRNNINKLIKNETETEKYIFEIQKHLINTKNIGLSNGINTLYTFLMHLKDLGTHIYVKDIFTTKHGSFTFFKNLMNPELTNENKNKNIFCSTVLPQYYQSNSRRRIPHHQYIYNIPFEDYYKRVSTWLIHYQRYGYTTIVLFGLNGGHWSVIHDIQQIKGIYYVSLVDHIYLYTELKHLLYLVWKKRNGSGYLCTFESNNSGINKSPNTSFELDFGVSSDNYLFKRSGDNRCDIQYNFSKSSFFTTSYTGQKTRQDTIFFNNMCFLDTIQYVLNKCKPELFNHKLSVICEILKNYKININKYGRLLQNISNNMLQNNTLNAESGAKPNVEPNAESNEISNEILKRYSMILYLSIYLRVIFIKYTDIIKKKLRYTPEYDIFTNLISILNLYGIITKPPQNDSGQIRRPRKGQRKGQMEGQRKGQRKGPMEIPRKQWRKQ